MNISTRREIEFVSEKTARVNIVTKVEEGGKKIEYRNPYLSGPAQDVVLYYEGSLTMDQVKKRWGIK